MHFFNFLVEKRRRAVASLCIRENFCRSLSAVLLWLDTRGTLLAIVVVLQTETGTQTYSNKCDDNIVVVVHWKCIILYSDAERVLASYKHIMIVQHKSRAIKVTFKWRWLEVSTFSNCKKPWGHTHIQTHLHTLINSKGRPYGWLCRVVNERTQKWPPNMSDVEQVDEEEDGVQVELSSDEANVGRFSSSTANAAKSRCCVNATLQLALSTPGLVVLVVVYSLMGALIFPLLEAPAEVQMAATVSNSRDECLKELWTITGERLIQW